MADPLNPEGETPTEDEADALGGGREQDDQRADDGEDPEVRKLRAEASEGYRLQAETDAQAKLKQRDDRDKTELQRLQEEAQAATRRADAAELAALKGTTAAQYGIPSEDAHRLQGDTREALVEDAKAFAKRLGLDGTGNGGGRPDFSSGVRRPVQRPKTMNDVIRQAAGR